MEREDIQIEQIPYYLTWKIRQEVLYPNQPLKSVKLEKDADALHFGLYVGKDLVSVISAFEVLPSVQIRKFATLSNHQSKGYGSALFSYTIAFLKKQGTKHIWLNARSSATPFYTKFGLKENGHCWITNGHSFKYMEKIL